MPKKWYFSSQSLAQRFRVELSEFAKQTPTGHPCSSVHNDKTFFLKTMKRSMKGFSLGLRGIVISIGLLYIRTIISLIALVKFYFSWRIL
jgi:hypothetical protein